MDVRMDIRINIRIDIRIHTRTLKVGHLYRYSKRTYSIVREHILW